MHSHTRSNFFWLLFGFGCASSAQADFQPIIITTNSYNHDIVVERTAAPPAVSVTTASMEQGIANSGFTWFERGYLPDWPATGLPEAGSILTSDLSPDHKYEMPATYKGSNAFLLDTTRPSTVITLSSPTNCAVMSLLTSSGGARNVIQYTVHYQNGSTERGSFPSQDWYSNEDPAWAANGKVNVVSFVHADLNSYNPKLYSADVRLSDVVTSIHSIELSLSSGSGHTAIFAVSGAPMQGAVFVPMEITGYTEDVVVEASAAKPGFLETNTTATLAAGINNSGFTWYEKGYNPAAPGSGLPAAGTLVTSESDADHHFLMPPSYIAPNSVLVDSAGTNPVITLQTPARYSAISFLTASSGGPVTNSCVVRHADGTSETNSFASPDWLDNTSPALTVSGRVSVSTRLIADQNSDQPRLYAVDVPIANQDSAIKTITVSRPGANAAGHCALFALAGSPAGNPPPDRAVLSITRAPNGMLTFRSTQPGRLESCSGLAGNGPNWRDEGSISQTVSLALAPGEMTRFYRVVAQ